MTKQKFINLAVWTVIFIAAIAIGYFIDPILALVWIIVSSVIVAD